MGDGNYLVAGGFDQELKIINLEKHIEQIEAQENTGQITSICKMGDKSFFTGSDDGTIRVWNCNDWTVYKESKILKKKVSQIVTDHL